MNQGETYFILLVIGILYFLPIMIAANRKHHNVASIAVVNVFLGWTLLGWVISLAWACSQVKTISQAISSPIQDYPIGDEPLN